MLFKIVSFKVDVGSCIIKSDRFIKDHFLHEGSKMMSILCHFRLCESYTGHQLYLLSLHLGENIIELHESFSGSLKILWCSCITHFFREMFSPLFLDL